MKEVFINAIHEENGITHGMAVRNQTAAENLAMMYSRGKLEAIINAIKNSGQVSGYFFDRYSQYIVYCLIDFSTGLSMQFSDFHDNSEAAFDYYMVLTDKGWKEADKIKIIEIFNDINVNRADIAKMTIKDPVDSLDA